MAFPDITTAAALMAAFAQRTGLDTEAAPVRYLWTDAFAVGNFQVLADAGAGVQFDALAQRTIEQVHAVLGHFRADDPREGWLRGAQGSADDAHPTRAGLRIGKPLPERGAGDAIDGRLEWERDGQYFHYLTRWMRALDRRARDRGMPHLNRWARELADAAHRAFAYGAAGRRRMVWKMSTDLSRPLVPSMGQHDPLDGLVAALTLRATAQAQADRSGPTLDHAVADYAGMLEHSQLATADPLGLGSLLMDAAQLELLLRAGVAASRPLLGRVLESALASLPHCALPLQAPAGERLGFRELGLAIGLGEVARLAANAAEGPLADDPHGLRRIAALGAQAPLGQAITAFWWEPAHRAAPSWTAHRDINEVMLATALLTGLPAQ
ncbi:hypothetical protein [Frateuria sp.]|uniref:hypothetical protein n=1 Tax=Frateuria sp. TaxID=2211372 RepID=UPI00182A390D|nr:hypothetical protein [Frateuria sp.]NUR21632.1 hypothetical protein [Frateuria sp.]